MTSYDSSSTAPSSEATGPGVPTVGVIGGGQLARMMAPAAVALGVKLTVLAEGPKTSATTAAPFTVGDYTDLPTLRAFAATVDVITFDHEHVPAEHLHALEQDGHLLRPGPNALLYAQDKLLMRQKMAELDLPQPRFAAVSSVEQLLEAAADIGYPVVLKTPRGGYDGKGVRFISTEAEARATEDWFQLPFEALLVEQAVRFSRELSTQIARRPSGQTAVYPVVESIQTDGVCDTVTAPAPDLDPQIASVAQQTAETIATQLGVTGMLAVEMFEDPEHPSGLSINELAMRPHNSGHWSMDGAVTGQFEQHLRAVLDLPLGDTSPVAEHIVMKNYLGGANQDLYGMFPQAMLAYPQAKIHAYGKSVRPGRKIGHVNVLATPGRPVAETIRIAEATASIIRDGTDATREDTTG